MRKGYRLQVLVYSLIFLVFFLLLPVAYNLLPVYAVDSSPSANLSDDLKTKLDLLKQEIASKAAKLKQEVDHKLQNKAYVGTIKSKSDTSLTLASSKGAKIVTINQDTAFESNIKSRPKVSFKNLGEEDYVAALGDIDDNGVLTARKLVLLAPAKDTKSFLWGQIISISGKLMTILTREQKNAAVSLTQANAQKGDEPISLSDLSARDFVIVTGNAGKNDIFQAEFVYVIPQGGVIRPKKVATPSATPTPKPSPGKKPS